MAQNTPLRFYYDTMLGSSGSSFSATSTSSTASFSIDNVYNFLEVNRWQAASSATQFLTYDAGVGNTKSADYLCIMGHNFNTAGASLSLQASTSGAFAGEQTIVSSSIPAADTVHLAEFTDIGARRYWQLRILTPSTPVSAAVLVWGQKSTIAFIQPPFDPYADITIANESISQGGYVAGLHTKYQERQIDISLPNSSTSVYNEVKTWHDTHGYKNFFMAWDSTSNSGDVYLVRPSKSFRNPINVDKFRNINLSLTGRKE